jgi:ABC-2 type transport system permease protein
MVRVVEIQAIYVMWLRQLKRFTRAKSRIVASIVQPLFFLFIFGFGFNRAVFPGLEGGYIHFLAPGIVMMGIMFSSMFAGVSVLWDKQFGFLQEVLVAPISRFSIIIGRTLGGATTALIQGFIILIIAFAMGVTISSFLGLLLTIVFMVLIAFTAVGFGLIIASKMEDFQGFQIIMNLIIMPLFLLSSAIFPVDRLPLGLEVLVRLNPLFYMVDGLRGSLTGANNIFPPLIDLGIVVVICFVMMGLGSYFFNRSEA